MKHEERVFMIILLVVTLTMAVMSLKFSRGARMLPFASGIVAAAMMGFLVVMAFSPRLKSWYQKFEEKAILTKISLSEKEKKRELVVAAWFIGCTFLIYFLGFMVGIPLFLFLFLKVWAKESWLMSVVLSGVVLGIVYLSFVHILQVPLHEGVFSH